MRKPEQFRSALHVEQSNADMLQVYIRNPVPDEAQKGVNCVVEVWPSNAGFSSHGLFDCLAWEESITSYELHGGRGVFKEFWRWLRMTSKKRGGFNVFSCYSPDIPVPLP